MPPVATSLSQVPRQIDPDQESVMKAKLAVLVLALAAMSPVHAANYVDLEQLASETGLTVRKVQMILGTRTAFAEYPYTYQRSVAKFRRALGDENYHRLLSGQPVKLSNGYEVNARRVAVVEEAAVATP
jgi:hypothetical protein